MQSPRTAATVSTTTVAAGAADYFQLIPWGAIASIVGIASTLVLIVLNLRRDARERKQWRAEMDILRAKEQERLAERADREACGAPLRRRGD